MPLSKTPLLDTTCVGYERQRALCAGSPFGTPSSCSSKGTEASLLIIEDTVETEYVKRHALIIVLTDKDM